MAQYYKVLSQSGKEDLTDYYTNIGKEVQYVITPEEQQQPFQGQQVKFSSL